jgi:hypothetical protein
VRSTRPHSSTGGSSDTRTSSSETPRGGSYEVYDTFGPATRVTVSLQLAAYGEHARVAAARYPTAESVWLILGDDSVKR